MEFFRSPCLNDCASKVDQERAVLVLHISRALHEDLTEEIRERSTASRPPMPTSFFDLPRELRDIIYWEVLISPTGYIEPVPIPIVHHKKPPANQIRRQRFKLRIFPSGASSSSPSSSEKNGVVSLSLARVCRQINLETRALFWKHNTFHFDTPYSLIKTLKEMGQIPSRLITSISLSLSISLCKLLPKALRLLASRTRHGAFRRLSLDIARSDLIGIARCKTSGDEKRIDDYDELLGMLREGSAGCKFERRMQVETMLRNWRVQKCLDHDTIRELHLAWGGRTFCNGELEWDNYEHVGNCAGMP